MNPYEYEYLSTMAKMNDKQKEDFNQARKWLQRNWKTYSTEEFIDEYDFVESPDENKEQIYRNDSVHILYCKEYEYCEILLNEEEEE